MTAAAPLIAAIPAPIKVLLDIATGCAASLGAPIYLVGGPVRDLLLARPLVDIDLVIEGDAPAVAAAFHDRVGGKRTNHDRFRTATVTLPDGLTIDFVTARRESYRQPAALPDVTPSTIADDLRRRDFTINTLALRLDQPALLDPFAGAADIRSGIVRVLHDRSFVDDPTRLLRAARFAGRFGYRIEPQTWQQGAQAITEQLIARTSAQRILNELWLTLNEDQPTAAVTFLHAWQAFPQLGLGWHADLPRWLNATTTIAEQPSLTRLALLAWSLDAHGRARLRRRYPWPATALRVLDALPADVSLFQQPPNDAALETWLDSYPQPALDAIAIAGDAEIAATILRYERIRAIAPLLTGTDLQQLGIAPGPHYRALLHALRAAQLAGLVQTADEARHWVQAHM